MDRLPYFMTMQTVTSDDIQAIRRMKTEQLQRALASHDVTRANPQAMAEAEAEMAYRLRA